ncbi:MAG: alpha/beta fold hydrolase [Sphingobium sp.]
MVSGMSPAETPVERRFVTVDGRALHYRVTGSGPAVVMLHDSPRSSRLHLDTMRRLSHRFCVYALDTPGYGNSDPLDLASPAIADFGAALGRALDALGLRTVPLYATHTSAKIALEHAVNSEPGKRPSRLILDGLSIPAGPPDPPFIDAYMRPFVIEGSGGYLAAEWTRMRDMLRWFPWFDQRPETRMIAPIPNDAWIADYVIDFMSAGPAYSSAYRAAMYYNPMPALRGVACPTLVAAKADDVLYGSLDSVPVADNASLTVERLPADREIWLGWLEEALAAAATETPPQVAQPTNGPVYASLPHGQMLVHRAGPAGETPLLILSAPTTLHGLAWAAAMPDRATLVPELPGFGESDALPSATLESAADALAAMLAALDVGEVDVLATGFASPLGAHLAARHPQAIRRVILDGCFQLGDLEGPAVARRLCPVIPFDGAGGHLNATWHMLRDGEASWPWYDTDGAAARDIVPLLAADGLHDALVGILKQPEHYGDIARAACTLGYSERYPDFTQEALLLNRPSDPAYRGTNEIAARLLDARLADRPADIPGAAEAVSTFLARQPAEASA